MASLERNQITAFSKLELLARQVVEGFITGLHKSPFHGFSVEFAEHRLYNTGESTRHLDWKLFARTDKLFVKRYEEETNLRCRIVIDASSSMNYPEKVDKGKFNKLQFSIHAAASLIELLRRQRDAYGLTFFSNGLDFHSEVKSNAAHRRQIYQELEKQLDQQESGKTTSAIETLHQISEMTHKRSLVVVFSDMFDDSDEEEKLFSALQHLRHNHHEVILFHVIDHKSELNFEFDNRPYRFVDMENGEVVKLNPGEVKDYYVEHVQKRQKALELKCGQYRIDYVPSDVGDTLHQVLLPFLSKRSKLY